MRTQCVGFSTRDVMANLVSLNLSFLPKFRKLLIVIVCVCTFVFPVGDTIRYRALSCFSGEGQARVFTECGRWPSLVNQTLPEYVWFTRPQLAIVCSLRYGCHSEYHRLVVGEY